MKTLSELHLEYRDLSRLEIDQRAKGLPFEATQEQKRDTCIAFCNRDREASAPEKLLCKIETAFSADALELLKDEIIAVRSTPSEFDEMVAAFVWRMKELSIAEYHATKPRDEEIGRTVNAA